MEQKMLDEIKAREQAATKETDWENVNSDLVYKDIPALIAEVERLTAAKEEINRYNIDCTKQCDKLLVENATLKKALELMHADAESSIGAFMPNVDEFIYQAEQLTHGPDEVTHGEAEKE